MSTAAERMRRHRARRRGEDEAKRKPGPVPTKRAEFERKVRGEIEERLGLLQAETAHASAVAALRQASAEAKRAATAAAEAEAERLRAQATADRAQAARAKAQAAADRAAAARAKEEAKAAREKTWQSMFDQGRDHRSSTPPRSRDQLAKLLGMLGSSHDGEVVNAARLVEQQRRKLGAQWEDLLK